MTHDQNSPVPSLVVILKKTPVWLNGLAKLARSLPIRPVKRATVMDAA
jgi:hypothetical protein